MKSHITVNSTILDYPILRPVLFLDHLFGSQTPHLSVLVSCNIDQFFLSVLRIKLLAELHYIYFGDAENSI